MRTLAILAAAMTLSMSGAGMALVTPAKAGTPDSTKAGAAKVTRSRRLTAEVVSVDLDAKTLTVKRTGRRAKELTFTVEPTVTSRLTDLKPGERVRVGYVETDGKLMAKTIDKASSHTTKQ